MKNRRPFNLGKLQMAHSLFHLAFNFYFVYLACYGFSRNLISHGSAWILKMTPRGTHDPRQFMKPSEAEEIFNKYNCHAINLQGFFFEFYRFKPDLSKIYILGVKNNSLNLN